MYVTPEKFAATQKAGVDAALSLVHTQFGAMEKLATLNMTVIKTSMEEFADHFKSLADAKDPQDMAKLNSAFAQPAVEKSVAYGKHVYDIATQAQSTVTKLAESHAAELNKAFTSLIDTMAKSAPTGSDPFVSAMKTTLAAVNTAYDSVSKAAKQAADVVEVNFAQASTKTRRRA